MTRFTTVFWDMDGTILDFQYSERMALGKVFCRRIGREITEEEIRLYSGINDSFWKKLELGLISKSELKVARFQTFFRQIGINGIDVGEFAQDYQEALGTVYSYIEDSHEILKQLKGRVKQYIVTNGDTTTQLNKIHLSGLEELIDGVFISDQIGAQKPSGAFFDYCLEQISESDKSKILLVGDSLTSDIKGAVNYGIPACWYCPEDAVNDTEYQEDFRIHAIRDVIPVIQNSRMQRNELVNMTDKEES